MLGRASGRHLHALAHNRDPRPVAAGRRRRSMGAQRALGRPQRSHEELDAALDRARGPRDAAAADGAHRVCRTVTLRLRFGDFTRATRSHTLPRRPRRPRRSSRPARGLLAAAMPTVRSRGLTLIGVAFGNLERDDAVQLALPLDRREAPALDAAVDGCATASAPGRSRARCCSGATSARRCRCSRTDGALGGRRAQRVPAVLPASTDSGVKGIVKTRLPQASKIALAITAPMHTMAGSPPPWGASPSLGTSTVSISGRSEKRGIR